MRREAKRHWRRLVAAFLLAWLAGASSYAQEDDPSVASHASRLTSHQQSRYQTLVTELRCLVCQNQSIADSNAPLAADLREQVRSQILAGRSDAEIHDYVTERYGDFVLYRPPFKPSTWLLWLGPFLLLVAALAFALRFVRRRTRTQEAAAPAVDRERLHRLLDEESK